MAQTIDQAFASPQEAWHKVSPKLSTARRLVLSVVLIPITLIVAAIFSFTKLYWIALLVVAVGVVIFIWLFWLIGRRVRSFGFVERDSDLLVTSGIFFRRLVIVPYGRMQLVDLVAGPIDRSMGLATVQLHTAAATTDAKIPGLTPDIAAGLRDRLAAKGEERSAGL